LVVCFGRKGSPKKSLTEMVGFLLPEKSSPKGRPAVSRDRGSPKKSLTEMVGFFIPRKSLHLRVVPRYRGAGGTKLERGLVYPKTSYNGFNIIRSIIKFLLSYPR